MHYDQVIDWKPDGQGVFTGETDESWSQGRAIFGGLVSAGALKVACSLKPERAPVEVHTRYIAPLPPGPVRATGQILRTGSSITQTEVRVEGSNGLCAVLSATLANPRASTVRVDPPPRPERPGPDGLQRFPHIPGLTPIYLQYMDMRWTEGHPPFTGSNQALVGGWCRIPETQLSGALVALTLLDTWPTPVLPMLTTFAPASTIAWTAWMHDLPERGDGWWFYREEATAARDGIAVSSASLYAPDGRLAASKAQSCAVFG